MAANCSQGLYPSLVGPAWENLDPRLQRFHSASKIRRGTGLFQIRHGETKLARLLAWLLRLPKEGQDVPARLVVREGVVPAGGNVAAEIWERSFRKWNLNSIQYANHQGLLAERFGLMEIWFQLQASDHSLQFTPAGGALALGPIRIKLPLTLCPLVRARVSGSSNISERFTVSVNVVAPFAGLVLAYDGYIEPEVTNS